MAKLVPLLMLSLAFSVFYKLMPNTKVQWRAALVGGLCGGTLWQLNNLMFVFYVSRIVTNNRIYGALGMIPVIMISLYLGWLFLLFGAQVAYAFQNRRAYVQDRLVEKLTPRGKEIVALRLMAELAARFVDGAGATGADELAARLRVPSRLIVSIVESLLDDELLCETNDEQPAYLPARSLSEITLSDIIAAVRNGTGGVQSELEQGGDCVTAEYERVIEVEMRTAGRTSLQAMAERLLGETGRSTATTDSDLAAVTANR
jgi:membrane protein